ncbi:HEPN domain-containing protein [Rhodoferax sp. U11-2br]|uniref:HEPN domain-containing protein n=1 Tax=Rhodoferax sp. U11-2br TaxID=2838878 RepID=UPI001BE73FD4|nr:HEPN domain-containing protein [Rhodoferax sp. U11-2br]MBT3068787.1 hypothetical protein [Rhodoferax sp. U11-2br]
MSMVITCKTRAESFSRAVEHPCQFWIGTLDLRLSIFGRRQQSDKTRKLFLDYLQVDVTAGWKWLNYDPATAKKTLDDFIGRRGDAVHRSKPLAAGAPAPHLVRREDLDKAIRFIKGLVEATERALDTE